MIRLSARTVRVVLAVLEHLCKSGHGDGGCQLQHQSWQPLTGHSHDACHQQHQGSLLLFWCVMNLGMVKEAVDSYIKTDDTSQYIDMVHVISSNSKGPCCCCFGVPLWMRAWWRRLLTSTSDNCHALVLLLFRIFVCADFKFFKSNFQLWKKLSSPKHLYVLKESFQL